MSRPRLLPLLLILGICVALRIPAYLASVHTGPDWFRYPLNFSPLYAICLFSAATYRDRMWAYAAPLIAYLIGTLGIAIVSNEPSDSFGPSALFTFLGFAMFVMIGSFLRGKQVKFLTAIGAGTAGAVLFYLVTNFTSWWLDPTMPMPTGYTRDFSGLMASYIAGIPFSWMPLVSTVCFSSIFFSPAVAPMLATDEEVESALAHGLVTQ